jgi:hypothetical protein
LNLGASIFSLGSNQGVANSLKISFNVSNQISYFSEKSLIFESEISKFIGSFKSFFFMSNSFSKIA